MTICPKCGKENTSSFVDTKDNTHGFHCDDCNLDFGVDDGKKLKKYEDLLVEFFYRKKEKDNTIKEVLIKKTNDSKFDLILTVIKNNQKTVSEPIDFSSYIDQFKKLLFENLFILDWNNSTSKTSTTGEFESYELDIKFKLGLLPPIKKDGINDFPPYEIALESILFSLFEGMI